MGKAKKIKPAVDAAQNTQPQGDTTQQDQGSQAPQDLPKDPPVKKEAKRQIPGTIKLPSFYSYYDEDGNHHQFAPETVITEAETIALLIERGVEHLVAE